MNNTLNLDYIFEVSWEVCNKVGGIHTVISTKSLALSERCGDLIFIGPDTYGTNENSEFIEEPALFAEWKQYAASTGLRVRTGRWNICGSPKVILISFTDFISEKDKIFADFWEDYKLDSLSGQWDYIEPALFGYTAGKVIESFCDFNLSANDAILAQFHEWMTGTGILYLKKNAPHIATAFTTHATAIGRSIAGNGLPLYKDLANYNGENMARQFNIVSKHSLEKISAINADVFTTVSDITQSECAQLLTKPADVVTPNGFEDDFIPKAEEAAKIRSKARQKMIDVAEKLTSYKFKEDPLIIATSGRYEYTNKGYNIFVDALDKLNRNANVNREILAYILVPGNNYGPQKSLLAALNGENANIENKNLTHGLHDAEYDPILNQLKRLGLTNEASNKVKVVFVPSYLNGDDGVFNMKYYDVLQGIDLTAFVSYYEPWGYTPLESIAFGVPTITTSLSGFGMWSKQNIDRFDNCVTVIDRNEDNNDEVVANLAERMAYFANLDAESRKKISESATAASKKALWRSLVEKYIAVEVAGRKIHRSIRNSKEQDCRTRRSNKLQDAAHQDRAHDYAEGNFTYLASGRNKVGPPEAVRRSAGNSQQPLVDMELRSIGNVQAHRCRPVARKEVQPKSFPRGNFHRPHEGTRERQRILPALQPRLRQLQEIHGGCKGQEGSTDCLFQHGIRPARQPEDFLGWPRNPRRRLPKGSQRHQHQHDWYRFII